MDTSYATYIYNHMTNAEEIVTSDIFNGNKFNRHKLKYIHMWGCHVYVLNTNLQQGHKLPKWKPHYCRGIFVVFSPNNSIGVPMIPKPDTGHISPS